MDACGCPPEPVSDPVTSGGLAAEREPFAVEPGWVDAYLVGNLGPVYRLLTYSNGTVRFEHRCDRGARGVIICAPALRIGSGHSITYSPCKRPACRGTHDVPTVRPSISCPDCGTHGFITDGRWADA